MIWLQIPQSNILRFFRQAVKRITKWDLGVQGLNYCATSLPLVLSFSSLPHSSVLWFAFCRLPFFSSHLPVGINHYNKVVSKSFYKFRKKKSKFCIISYNLTTMYKLLLNIYWQCCTLQINIITCTSDFVQNWSLFWTLISCWTCTLW